MSGALLTSGANGDLKTLLDQVERSAIQEAMARHRGNKKRVAEELGISRSYLYKKLEEQRGPGGGPVPAPDALERHVP
jgi:transcriptional regulator with PAS, ATPase and Fis domain